MRRAAALALGFGLALVGCLGRGAGPSPDGAPPESGETSGISAAEPGPSRPDRPALVLLVAVSGLAPGDYAGDAPVMPTLARLAAGGAAADDLEPVAPASRAPAHASLVTGRRPARHGIMSDRLLGEKGVRRAGFDHASYLRGPSLWSEGVAAGRSVAALGWPTPMTKSVTRSGG